MVSKSDDYGNGRYVRKILEEAEMNLADRILKLNEAKITDELLMTIDEADIPEINMQNMPRKTCIGFAR